MAGVTEMLLQQLEVCLPARILRPRRNLTVVWRRLQMPLLWDRSCTSQGGCPEGTRCAQATQSSLVCDTGLIRDMIEPSLSSWTTIAIVRAPRPFKDRAAADLPN